MRRFADRTPAARRLVLYAALAVAACWAEGCGRSPQQQPGESLLRVGISTDVKNWFLAEFPDGDSRFVWSQVYETLVRLSPDLKLQPGLAVEWSSSEGGKTWEFRLREGVRFHDGTPLTAEAVVFSYGPGSYARKTVLRPVQRIEAAGPQLVRFTLTRPMPLPYYLTHVGWPIMAPTCVDEEGRFLRPVGTGPFRFESRREDQEILLSRNDDYWGQDGAGVDEVAFKVIPDSTARVIALEAGELEMIVKVPESDVRRLAANEEIDMQRAQTTFTDFIQFNCRQGPCSDVRVRRAVALSVDTRQLVATVLEGVGRPAGGKPFSPIMLYSDPDLEPLEPDVAEARQLLAQAGWRDADGDGVLEKDGRPLRLVCMVTSGGNVGWGARFHMMSEAIQTALGRVGMDAQIRQLEGGAFLKAERDGEFDVLLRTGFYVWGSYPRHFFLHHSGNVYSHFNDPQLDRLIEAADAAADPDQQRALYGRLQQRTLELLPAFYLVHQEKLVAVRSRVTGYRISSEPAWLNLQGVHLRPR